MVLPNDQTLNYSILYRCMHKFFDLKLTELDINAGQIAFLTIINENEGISLSKLADICSFDKGTVTKAIQKLSELNYIELKGDNDKRIKNLFLTEKAKVIMPKIYALKQEWFSNLTASLTESELETYLNLQNKVMLEAKKYLDINNQKEDLKIFGFQKTTLLDYPSKLASTIFLGGCNFICPFCQNSDLVLLKENLRSINVDVILSYLDKRKNILDGVCISGGEPLLNPHLKYLIKEIKKLGLLVKVDTNGTNYEHLKELIDLKLIDYVAMDIKNSKEKYSLTTGLNNIDLTNIEKSINLLKENKIDYEFRTTLVKEFHTKKDIEKIGFWLKGAKNFYLQNFRLSEGVFNQNLHGFSLEELNEFKQILENYIKNVNIRGI